MVFEGLPIERQTLFAFGAALLLVEARAGFVAQQLALDHLRVEGRKFEIATLIEQLDIAASRSGERRREPLGILHHMAQNIQSYHVDGAEGGRLREADGSSGQRVHVLNGEVELLHQADDVDHAKSANAVGDEVRRVLRVNDALAETDACKLRDRLNRLRIALWSRNDLQQAHIARRIEKMGTKPVAAEIVTEALGNGVHGKAAGIAGNDGSGLADSLDLAQQSALEIKVFHHGFDDPVAVGQQVEIVFEISGGDQARQSRLHEGCRLGFARRLQPCFGNAVASRCRGASLGVWWNNIQQVRTHPGIGQVRGDAGTHRSRAEDGDFLDSFQHR